MHTHKNFTQMMTFRSDNEEEILAMARDWDTQQAMSDIMGYIGMRVLVDRSEPNRYVMLAEFGIVDPDVPAAEEAMRNNDRPETQAANRRLLAVVEGDVEYHDYDEIYRTDF
jgi:hypothetical protein